jgi:hypothetical protein
MPAAGVKLASSFYSRTDEVTTNELGGHVGDAKDDVEVGVAPQGELPIGERVAGAAAVGVDVGRHG